MADLEKSSSGRVLLAVLAHPDDESFGMGGTLALYARRGVAVHLICATRGEAGAMQSDLMEGYASVGERRAAELRCAAGILGLSSVHFLDYRDSGMPGSPDNQHPQALINAPLEQVAGRIAHRMRQLKPQVVITFDPIGGYKHPDHIAIHRATVRAFELAADPAFQDEQPPYRPQKLYFHVFPKRLLKVAAWLLPLLGRDPRRFGQNGDIDLLDLARSGDFPVHARIDCRAVQEQRQAAAACHSSQLAGAGMANAGLMSRLMRRLGGWELFMRYAPPATRKTKEKDLFAGIV